MKVLYEMSEVVIQKILTPNVAMFDPHPSPLTPCFLVRFLTFQEDPALPSYILRTFFI